MSIIMYYCRAFIMLENYVRIIQVCVGIANSAQIYYSFPDIRHAFLEWRRAALSKECNHMDLVLKYSRMSVMWTLHCKKLIYFQLAIPTAFPSMPHVKEIRH